MTSIISYQQLHTETLLTCNFTRISENFKTIDKFLKDFSTFQRKLSDLEKSQKATAQDLANFKLSTQNTFSTLNDVVESRNGLSVGKSMADAEQMQQIKKSFTQLKKFITQNTRDQHQAQTIRDEEQAEHQAQITKKFQSTTKEIQKNEAKAKAIETQLRQLRLKLATKNQVQKVRSQLVESQKNIEQNEQQISNINQLLIKLNVKGFKQTIDKMQVDLENQLADMKKKLRLKSDISDTIKLQEMILNLINFTFDHLSKKSADRVQTKKALVFLEKRINKVVQIVLPQQQGDHEAMLATRGWKCVSCTKDLGEFQGKLDKYKPWSIFPAKQSPVKDRYSGFGAGFQSVMQSTATKKGLQVTFDQKGRMTTPFNLTRQVQTNLLKPSYSNSKLKQSTGFTKSRGRQQLKPIQMQTNYMNLYGKNSELEIDIKDEYAKRYRGLLAFVKTAYQQNKHDTEE